MASKSCLYLTGPASLRREERKAMGRRRFNHFLKETAEKLGIPCWQVPAEAEAECPRMQELGIVDAVFSEDTDTFMFRGETVLRFQVDENRKKSNTHALMYRMAEIEENCAGMNWKNLVLFAAVVGGDYAMKGRPGCGPKVALDAARQGFGVSLVDAFKKKRDCMYGVRVPRSFSKTEVPISLFRQIIPMPGS